MTSLGARRLRLERDRLVLDPSWRSRAQTLEVLYVDIVSVSIVGPHVHERGTLILQLRDGGQLKVTFARRATLRARRLQQELRKRVRAAHARR